MSKFIEKEIKKIKNEFATIASNGIAAGDYSGCISTSSYILNALLTGSIYGGFPLGKVTALAGTTGVGKSYFVMDAIYNFLNSDPSAEVVLFESESALTKNMMETRGIDTERVLVIPCETVQGFRTECLGILNDYLEMPKKERPPLMMCLDSLGNLSTTKEFEDIESGKETVDMTRAKLIRATFRTLTLRLGKAGVPLLMTNHTYSMMSQYSADRMSGGEGLYFSASTIIFLTRKKERVGTDVVGNIIHCTAVKSRFTKENSKVDTLLLYDSGLHKFYGLVDLSLQIGLIKKDGNKVVWFDGEKHFKSHIYKNADKFFTKEVLDEIDENCAKHFCYGNEIDDLDIAEPDEEEFDDE